MLIGTGGGYKRRAAVAKWDWAMDWMQILLLTPSKTKRTRHMPIPNRKPASGEYDSQVPGIMLAMSPYRRQIYNIEKMVFRSFGQSKRYAIKVCLHGFSPFKKVCYKNGV